MPSRRPTPKPRIRKKDANPGEFWSDKVHKERRIQSPNLSGHLGTFRMTPIRPVFGLSKRRRLTANLGSRLPLGELNHKKEEILLFDDLRHNLPPHNYDLKKSVKRPSKSPKKHLKRAKE